MLLEEMVAHRQLLQHGETQDRKVLLLQQLLLPLLILYLVTL
jgi:hypothetical protein